MSLSPKDILINKAIAFFNDGQLKKSIKVTLRAKKKFPDEPFIYNLLGVYRYKVLRRQHQKLFKGNKVKPKIF